MVQSENSLLTWDQGGLATWPYTNMRLCEFLEIVKIRAQNIMYATLDKDHT